MSSLFLDRKPLEPNKTFIPWSCRPEYEEVTHLSNVEECFGKHWLCVFDIFMVSYYGIANSKRLFWLQVITIKHSVMTSSTFRISSSLLSKLPLALLFLSFDRKVRLVFGADVARQLLKGGGSVKISLWPWLFLSIVKLS